MITDVNKVSGRKDQHKVALEISEKYQTARERRTAPPIELHVTMPDGDVDGLLTKLAGSLARAVPAGTLFESGATVRDAVISAVQEIYGDNQRVELAQPSRIHTNRLSSIFSIGTGPKR